MEVVWGFAVTVELRGDGVGVLWWPCGTWGVTVGDPRVTTGLPWGDAAWPCGDNRGWPVWGPAVTVMWDIGVTVWDPRRQRWPWPRWGVTALLRVGPGWR